MIHNIARYIACISVCTELSSLWARTLAEVHSQLGNKGHLLWTLSLAFYLGLSLQPLLLSILVVQHDDAVIVLARDECML
jgi:hypothetical protein